MEAIRRKKIKTINRKVIIDLPENFSASEVDVIVWPSVEEDVNKNSSMTNEQWRKELKDFYAQFKVDLSSFKFNRDELYDR